MTRSQNTSTDTPPQARTILLKLLNLHSNPGPLRQERERKPIAPRRPLWENVVARVTIDDKTGHVMSLEYTKDMTEKHVHRNLPSVRDIRTMLLHFSPVTPNQQLKQPFQTFAALPVDETTQQTSQIQTAAQDELSVGSDRPGVTAKDLFKSLILSGEAVVGLWMKATRYGRVDFAEVCCTSESLLSGAVTSIGGRAVQHSHWNGFDLTTKAGMDNLKEDLLEKKQRFVWMTPPRTTQRTQQSQSRCKVSSSKNEHLGSVSLACEARLV